MRYPRKLIETVLPLDQISKGGAHEKNVHSAHPSTLHLWWARRPLTVARAVLFAQCVNDPEDCPDLFPTPEARQRERQRLLRITERLAQWGNSRDKALLDEARDCIWASWRYVCARFQADPDPALRDRVDELFHPDALPAVHDPFAGGGSIPIEARRLGFEAWASDLNPVAVLINRFMLEVPPRFAGQPPVNPESRSRLHDAAWRGAAGLAEDLRYYARRVVEEARARVGRHYPPYRITAELAAERPDLAHLVGREVKPLTWIWARTVRSANPAVREPVPLVTSFLLSRKDPGAYIAPVVENGSYRFTVRTGRTEDPAIVKGTRTGRGAFRCLVSGVPIPLDHIRAEGRAGRMGARLMAVVAENPDGRGKLYLPPTAEQEAAASVPPPPWKPDNRITGTLGITTPNYGLSRFSDLFTPRQLLTLTTLSDCIRAVMEEVRADWQAAHPERRDDRPFTEGGAGAPAYAQTIATGLAFALDKCCDYNSALASWNINKTNIRHTFVRQALSMVWDYAEADPLGAGSGGFMVAIKHVTDWLEADPGGPAGHARQADAAVQTLSAGKILSTDPPYYDYIAYADISDFFYVWLRPTLKDVHPDRLATLATPKEEEIVAASDRHGGKEGARNFFLDTMTRAMRRLAEQVHPAFPVTIYYAHKDGTGWPPMIDAIRQAGLIITASGLVYTERQARKNALSSQTLSTSALLVCRRRENELPILEEEEFLCQIKSEAKTVSERYSASGLSHMDVKQAVIAHVMALYTRCNIVTTAGSQMNATNVLKIIDGFFDIAKK